MKHLLLCMSLVLLCFSSSLNAQCEGDTTPPVITIPDGFTIDCDEDWPPFPSAMCTDDCTEYPLIPTFTFWYIDNKCGYQSQVRLWAVSDAAGNTTSASQVIVQCDISAPTFIGCPDDITIECDDDLPAIPEIAAIDNCEGNVVPVFAESTIPLFSCEAESQLIRTWTAMDSHGNTNTCTQVVTILDTTAPYSNTELANLTADCSNIPASGITVGDNCDANPEVILTEKIIPGECDNSYDLYRTYLIIDDCGNFTEVNHTITVVDNVPPVFDVTPDNIIVDCGNVPSPANVTAEDACTDGLTVAVLFEETSTPCSNGSYLINRTWTSSDDCGNTSVHTQTLTVIDEEGPVLNSLPSDVTLTCNDPLPSVPQVTAEDACTGSEFVYYNETSTFDCPGTYTIYRSWTSYDDCGNESSHTQTISVIDDVAPVLNHNLDLEIWVECDAVPVPENLTASDDCSSATVTVANIEFPGSCEDTYTLERVYVASDECGNTSAVTQTIHVSDTTMPTFDNAPADTEADCGDFSAAEVTASDNCDSDVSVWYSDSYGDCSISRTWYASDNCNNVSEHLQIITFDDDEAPEFVNAPENTSISCNELEEPYLLEATDNCSDPFVSVLDKIAPGSQDCPNTYTLLRIWSAVDPCGNSATHTQVIQVSDFQAPSFNQSMPQSTTISCDVALPNAPNITATDNCSSAAVEYNQQLLFDNGCTSQYLRTWIATDECSNSNYHYQYITVSDFDAPEFIVSENDPLVECENDFPFTCSLIDLEAECDNIPAPWAAPATDNCDTDVFVDVQESIIAGDCFNEYEIVRSYTAYDNCGNASETLSHSIFVSDNTAPTFVDAPADEILYCNPDFPPVESPTAEDNCDTSVPVVFSQEVDLNVLFGSVNADVIYRTWTATDNCGNENSYTQQITLVYDCPSNGCVSLFDFLDAPQTLTPEITANKVKFHWEVPSNALKAQIKITSTSGNFQKIIHNMDNLPVFQRHISNFVPGVEYDVKIRYASQIQPCIIASSWSDLTSFTIPASNSAAQIEITDIVNESSEKFSDFEENADLNLYPNPNNGEFVLETELSDYQIEVFDLTGKLVYSEQNTNSYIQRIDLGNVESGMYIVRLTNASQTIAKRFIVK